MSMQMSFLMSHDNKMNSRVLRVSVETGHDFELLFPSVSYNLF